MFVGCLLLGVGLKERSGLVHSVGRYAPVRLRAWTLRDSGRVPLTPQKNAKDGELRTQLAALRQVSAALQRILLRAKRKPAPGIRRSMPGASPELGTGGEDADAALGWWWECLQLSNGFPEATIQVWSFIGDGMAVKGIEGRDDRDAYCTERANW